MNRTGYERRIRQAHRWFGLGALGFLLLSVSTGLLWADAKFLYWDERYKEKLRPMAGPTVESASVPIDRVFLLAKEAVGGHAVVEQTILRSDFGRLIYEVRLRGEGLSTTLLLDAISGERLSPISEELAPIIAAQYVRSPAAVTGVNVERYIPRKKKRAYDAVRVRFDDAAGTEIILDRQTGEILEDEGRWRQVHFAVMQLHQLNFFGFEKTLLNIPGIPLLLMGFSGLALWGFQRTRARRAKAAPVESDGPSVAGPSGERKHPSLR
jgi:uncharacterized membrane protein YkoI